MKVLHIINTLSAGGAELHLLALSRHLKRQGVELAVACFREQVKGSRSLRADFEKEHIRVIDLDADSRYNLRFLGRLVNVVKREKPDILHSHLPRADIATALVSRFVSAPVFISSVHGIYRDRWFGAWAAPLMRLAYQRATAVIAISSAVKSWLRQDYDIEEDKIQVVHYGIETDLFSGVETPERISCKDHSERFSVGSIGRLEPGKGFDCLIGAMAIVKRRFPRATLRIAGHDPRGFGETLQAQITRHNLGGSVRLVGFQRDVAGFLRGLDVFAFASRTEGFGQVVIEAMASGLPVIVSDIAPLTEIVRHEDTGLLVKPGDADGFASALERLLGNPAEANEMGKRGQAWVRSHFSATQMAHATRRLYAALMRESDERRTGTWS